MIPRWYVRYSENPGYMKYGKNQKDKEMRLDRFLAEQTGLSRKQVREEIKKGRVTVNSVVTKEAEFKVEPEGDEVSLGGRRIGYRAFHYYMLNKPAGVISSTKREQGSPFAEDETEQSGEEETGARTVLELLPKELRRGLSPVGRLDKDTEGLLLLTDDGALLHRLISPKHHVRKVYEVHLKKEITDEELERLKKGVDIGDEKPTLPAEYVRREADEEGRPVIELTIYEGRYHQVKRMLAAVNNKVIYLKRLAIGEVVLDPALKPGEFREVVLDPAIKPGEFREVIKEELAISK